MEEQEQNKRWITILLVIGNIIIWSIIMIFIAIAKVDAAASASEYNTNTIYLRDTSGTYHSYQNTSRQTVGYNTNLINYQWTQYQGGVTDLTVVLRIYNYNRPTKPSLNINVTENGSQVQTFNSTYTCGLSWNQSQLVGQLECSIHVMTILNGGTYFEVSVTPNNVLPYIDFQAYGTAAITPDDSLSNETFISGINNQTNTIVNNINDLKDGIINVITEQNETCKNYNYTNEPIEITGKYINANGIETNANGNNISEYIEIKANETYIYSSTTGLSNAYCLYNKKKELINCSGRTTTGTINIVPQQNGYIRYNILSNQTITFKGNYCITNAEQQHDDAMDILDKLQHSTPWEERTANISDFEDYEDAEEILNEYTDVDFNSVQIDLDPDTNNWVWNTLTSLINTNRLVFGMIISILSIGIIKLILNR